MSDTPWPCNVQALDKVVEEAGSKIKGMILAEMQGLTLPKMRFGERSKDYSSLSGFCTASVYKPGVLLNKEDRGSYGSCVILLHEGIYRFDLHPFLVEERSHVTGYPEWGSQREPPKDYINHGACAFIKISDIKSGAVAAQS